MRDLYPGISGTEVDLRSEFQQLMEGSSGEIPKQQSFILRRMRRDSDEELMACDCVDSLTKEPDKENVCVFCHGEGYYFDEVWVKGYTMFIGPKGGHSNRRTNMAPGLISSYDKVFYLPYNTIITYDDKIVELKLDSNGKPIVPYRRKMIFRPETIMEMRADNGRIEYFAIYVNENNGIRVK